MYSPLQAHEENPSLLYLKEAKVLFEEWRQSGKTGLTVETFTACLQTMGAAPELAQHLKTNHGLEYLLTGKLMSDPIEGHFGWYRQDGGNFYMSVK